MMLLYICIYDAYAKTRNKLFPYLWYICICEYIYNYSYTILVHITWYVSCIWHNISVSIYIYHIYRVVPGIIVLIIYLYNKKAVRSRISLIYICVTHIHAVYHIICTNNWHHVYASKDMVKCDNVMPNELDAEQAITTIISVFTLTHRQRASLCGHK